MFWLPIAIGVGTLLGLAAVTPKRPPAGKGSTDVLPPGWGGKPVQVTQSVGKSGTRYNVLAWKVVNGEDYFTAEVQGDPASWIGWIRTVSTGKRRFFRGVAQTPAARDMMLADFGVSP